MSSLRVIQFLSESLVNNSNLQEFQCMLWISNIQSFSNKLQYNPLNYNTLVHHIIQNLYDNF